VTRQPAQRQAWRASDPAEEPAEAFDPWRLVRKAKLKPVHTFLERSQPKEKEEEP
jgi:hypothetical protein